MFVDNKVNPAGCNPIGENGRMPVVKVVSGDSWEIRAEVVASDGSPATPSNSFVEFVLSENQFSPALWTGTWNSGIIPYENRKGFVRIVIPHDFTKTLRRGSYQFSLRVADRMRHYFNTQLAGHFLVEYMPTSDQHSIPYRDDTSEIFGSSSTSAASETITEESAGSKTSTSDKTEQANCSCTTDKIEKLVEQILEKKGIIQIQ